MLDFSRTRINFSIESPVVTGSTITAEGQPVVGDNSTGTFGVKPAPSAAAIFYGVSYGQQLTITALPMYEVVTVPTGGGTGASLSRTNITSGSVAATASSTGALTVITSGSPAAGEVKIDLTTGALTFNAAESAQTVTFGYRYAPTTVEVLTLQGNIPAGGAASLLLDSIGVIRSGVVYTTEFDTSVDWSASNPTVKVYNGLFTIGGSGATVPNATIVQVPAVGDSGGVGTGASVLGIAF